MAVVYVREQRSIVRKHLGRIVVEKEGKQLLEIPLRQTDSVAVFGDVQVTTQALGELLDQGIPLAIYTRNGRLKGHLATEVSKNVLLRVAQYKLALDDSAALGMAKAIVRAKLLNSAKLLADYREHYPSEELAAACKTLRKLADEAGAARDHAALLGYEGSGAAAYFAAFARLNRSGLKFEGRRKHPPRDPVNGLLSLGYTLALNEIRSLVEGAGMEPHVGFLHRVDYGRPSLALDLLEAFRAPLVDRLTLKLINERMVTEFDFATRVSGPGAGSLVLAPEPFRKYLEAYETAVGTAREKATAGMREEWRGEVERLAGAIREGTRFAPYCEAA